MAKAAWSRRSIGPPLRLLGLREDQVVGFCAAGLCTTPEDEVFWHSAAARPEARLRP